MTTQKEYIVMSQGDKLDRIIALLESIDESLKVKNARAAKVEQQKAQFGDNQYYRAIIDQLDYLKGRKLTTAEISDIIGMPYDSSNHNQRLELGAAIALAGAKKGRSGSARYYQF